MRKKIVLLCLCILGVGASNVEAKFRALLVGLDYQNADALIKPLNGAVHDVNALREVMITTLGIPPDAIRTLTETQATRANILRNFQEWLIDDTTAGDVVFFQYAGHGVRVPDPTGTQTVDPVKQEDAKAQALAEAFVPYDTILHEDKTAGNLILDSELYALLNQLRDRRVYLFLDSCFSGGATRDQPLLKVSTRYLDLPWPPEETHVILPRTLVIESTTDAASDLQRARQKAVDWQPSYAFFASAKHTQLAREYRGEDGVHGAFTYAVLRFLRANPANRYTNRQVLDYARKFLHNDLGYDAALQEPVFYGPAGAQDQPFVLLTQTPAAPPAIATPLPVATTNSTAVLVEGQAGTILSNLQNAIATSNFLRLETSAPDVLVKIESDAVIIAHVAGKLICMLPLSQDVVAQVIAALEHVHLVRQLAVLENPAAPFAVDLWIDEPGKTQFTTRDRVTLYYRVNGLPHGQKAYLTLLNVAPDGTVAILYPQKKDFAPGVGTKLYFNAEVEPGKVYSIPKGQPALQSGQNVAVDLRLRLAAGEEYFKAIVTSEPIDWEQMQIGAFQTTFQGAAARGVIVEAVEQTAHAMAWATAALRVEVKK